MTQELGPLPSPGPTLLGLWKIKKQSPEGLQVCDLVSVI